LRSPIFIIAALRSGPHAAIMAGAVDASFRLGMAGVIGACVQHLAQVRPLWLANVSAMGAIPIAAHSIEALVHWEAATPQWRSGFRVSVLVSVITTLFDLYAMRRGALLTGASARPFSEDLRRLPALIVGFVRRPLSPNNPPSR
jgi:hypothetical protein